MYMYNLYSNNKMKKKKKKKRKKQNKKQLCSFLFFDASGFSVHTVTAHVTEGGGGGPVLSEDDEGSVEWRKDGARGS